jgi:heme/copper-type cytochrome/quinol oxidase subunit 2
MHRPTAPALLLATALALTACAGGDDDAAAPTPSPTAVLTAVPPSEGTTEPEPVVTPDDAQVVAITVAGGQATGDTGRVEVPMGTTVRLTVTSDAADQLHVHGFDLTAAVSPGQATQREFVADRPGIFEVELHDARQVLTRLQIS